MKLQNFIFRNLYQKTFISFLLLPFSLIYYLGTLIDSILHKIIGNPVFFKVRIIVIGNIVSGGTGKTPFTIYLANLLSRKGYKVAVSHRDYKGGFEKKTSLISDRQKVYEFSNYACDEAQLIATSLPGIPVVGGKNRIEAINLLCRTFPDLDYVILDDSFQNKKIIADYKILLFNATGGYGNGFLLPAGILREPLKNCKKADCIIINGKKRLKEIEILHQNVLQGSLRIEEFCDESGNIVELSVLQNNKCALMSAIGNPHSFEKTITENNISFITHFAFPDHFDYQSDNWNSEVTDVLNREKIAFVITTEKDFTKLKRIKKEFDVVILKVRFHLANNDESFLIEQVTS
ncbi:MAG: tetraacyldisaccharide 4'-kinase [Candidatus Cloacimonetes bacterium]|nr:tetraacyldisaccharide 4'-kinase [Candidatus Cloacimonadota bacterium]